MQYKWTALTVTTVGTLMAGLNARIVTVGLPTIAQQLHVGADQVVWITQAYFVASTVSLLLVGRASDQFGRVKLFNIGFLIFTVGSTLSSLALDSYQLIGFRLIQGVGSGILITNSSAIITDASPKKELGTMLGINQTAFRVGNVIGLSLSGVMLSIVDWRGLFYVNIPIGIFGTLWAYKRLHEISTKDESRAVDWKGFTLFSSGLTLVLLAVTFLSYGSAGYFTGNAFLLAGVILIVFFLKIESKAKSPLLDLALFRIRLFAMGNVAQLLNSMAWGGLVLVLAFYLQIGLGYTPLESGLGILPLDFSYLLFSLIGGKLSDTYGSRALTTCGSAIVAFAFFAMSTFTSSTQYLEIAMVLSIFGLGNGLFNPPNLKAIMGSVPSNRVGIASGFRNLMFDAGSTISYGLVVLLITFGIPYGTFSMLLQAAPQTITLVAREEFLNGFSIASVGLGLINAAAIVPCIISGEKQRAILKQA